MIKTYKDLKNYHSENNSEIPKIIFRTGKFRVDEIPTQILDIYHDELNNNPEYTLFYFDDKDCQDFINSLGYDRLIKAYEKLIPTAYKADLWRYCILHKYGGIYIDFTHRALCKYDEIIKDYTEVYVKNYPESHGIYNAFMCTHPNSKILNKVIELSIDNIEKENFGDSFMDIVSCNTLRKAYNIINNKPEDSEIEVQYWQKEHIYDSNNNMLIKSKDFSNYYHIIYSTNELKNDYPSTHYKNLWKDKIIFKNERWIELEKLYRKHLLREADLDGIVSYYKTLDNISFIEECMLNSVEYKNLIK